MLVWKRNFLGLSKLNWGNKHLLATKTSLKRCFGYLATRSLVHVLLLALMISDVLHRSVMQRGQHREHVLNSVHMCTHFHMCARSHISWHPTCWAVLLQNEISAEDFYWPIHILTQHALNISELLIIGSGQEQRFAAWAGPQKLNEIYNPGCLLILPLSLWVLSPDSKDFVALFQRPSLLYWCISPLLCFELTQDDGQGNYSEIYSEQTGAASNKWKTRNCSVGSSLKYAPWRITESMKSHWCYIESTARRAFSRILICLVCFFFLLLVEAKAGT